MTTASAYDVGFAEVLGDASQQLSQADLVDKTAKALSLLQDALAEAQKIIADESSGVWASLKAKVTGVDLDAAKNQVTTLAADVDRMAKVQAGFDASTPVAKLQDFVLACKQMADLTVLKDSVARNNLGDLAKEVGTATVKDTVKAVATEVKAASGSLVSGLWDPLPWWGKVLVVAVPSAAVFLGLKSKIERW
jgi:hypothetical protein